MKLDVKMIGYLLGSLLISSIFCTTVTAYYGGISPNDFKETGKFSDCFDKSWGEIIQKIQVIPSAALCPIDYNNDGSMDVIIGEFYRIFLLEKRSTSYTMNHLIDLPKENTHPESLTEGGICSADYNHDGLDDFVTGGINGVIRLFLNTYQNDGTPSFEMVELFDVGRFATGLTSADFNNDGNADFAVSCSTDPFAYSQISIYYNMGNGIFQRKDVFTSPDYLIDSLDANDYDHDGDIDFVFCYSENKEYRGANYYVTGISALLINDGKDNFPIVKIISTRGSEFLFGGTLVVNIWINYVRLMLGDERIHPHISSGDYDNDGDIDLLIGDNSGKVEYFENLGNNVFDSTGVIRDFGTCSWGLASADFDNDGDIDFMVVVMKFFPPFTGIGYIYLKANKTSIIREC